MSKFIKFPAASSTTGTSNRFGRSRLGGGPTPKNSNARIVAPPRALLPSKQELQNISANLGLNSDRLRHLMVDRLRDRGITNETVLSAMRSVPRHLFVDQGLASRAYEDAALPIGYSQTISQPWVVARMLSVMCENGIPEKVLEVGGGCGYQAAVLGHFVRRVYVIERIKGLYQQSVHNLKSINVPNHVTVKYGDGMLGLPDIAPFDAIIIAAAGINIPDALLQQMSLGGSLIAPEGNTEQRLVLIRRIATNQWQRQELDAVKFVPLRSGLQP